MFDRGNDAKPGQSCTGINVPNTSQEIHLTQRHVLNFSVKRGFCFKYIYV